MSRLNVVLNQAFMDAGIRYGARRPKEALTMRMELTDATRPAIKALMLELIGEVEQRETQDMTLKSWSTDDYKAFGKNELKIELTQKVNEL